jgi:hypothetical protein
VEPGRMVDVAGHLFGEPGEMVGTVGGGLRGACTQFQRRRMEPAGMEPLGSERHRWANPRG